MVSVINKSLLNSPMFRPPTLGPFCILKTFRTWGLAKSTVEIFLPVCYSIWKHPFCIFKFMIFKKSQALRFCAACKNVQRWHLQASFVFLRQINDHCRGVTFSVLILALLYRTIYDRGNSAGNQFFVAFTATEAFLCQAQGLSKIIYRHRKSGTGLGEAMQGQPCHQADNGINVDKTLSKLTNCINLEPQLRLAVQFDI